MGTKSAPTIANLVMGYLEIKLYSIIENRFNTDIKKKFKGNFKRFLDDCFLIWNPDDGNITDLMNMLWITFCSHLHPQ